MNDMTKQFEQFADMMKAVMPQVKANKNGYEIRTKVLEMAKDNVWSDYHAKFAGWEQTVTRDPETGEVVTTVSMPEAVCRRLWTILNIKAPIEGFTKRLEHYN